VNGQLHHKREKTDKNMKRAYTNINNTQHV